MKATSLLSKAGLNGFFFLLIAVVGLAWVHPTPGTDNGALPLKAIANIGVSLIFFFYGLKLSPEKLWAGIGHWKLHGIIQSTTFILFPAIVLFCYGIFYRQEFQLWWIGVFYIAALPSTVSSSVVMVSIAGGNMSAAIFNASISSLIGIFVTPVWMSLFVDRSALAVGDLSSVIVNLCLQVLLPVMLGLMLHRKFGFLTERFKKGLRNFDQFIILLIVYRAFSQSFAGNMFDGYSLTEIAVLSLLMLLLFLVLLLCMQGVSSLLKFSREDRITIIFCGSKKSLVQGAVMGQVLFPDATVLGIILLPLMLYHALQLLAGSILAQRMAAKT